MKVIRVTFRMNADLLHVSVARQSPVELRSQILSLPWRLL